MSDTIVNGRFLRASPTGLHRVARELVSALDRRGTRLDVWAPEGIADPRVDRHLTTWDVPMGDHLTEQLVLPRAARDRRVLSLTNTSPLAHRDAVVMVHDLAPLIGPTWYRRSVRAYGHAVLAGARRASHVLTVSEATANDLRRLGVTGPIDVVAPGLDHLAGPASPAAVAATRRRHGLDRPFLLFVGWADPRKDVVTAVAAHRLARRDLDHDLVLVGLKHPTFAPVPVPTGDRIRLLGYVDEGDLHALLSSAAALVYPSRHEGFGLPPLEAVRAGTPALVSDIPVLRESGANAVTFVPEGDVRAWAAAMVAALRGDLAAGPVPTRTWNDAADELIAILGPR